MRSRPFFVFLAFVLCLLPGVRAEETVTPTPDPEEDSVLPPTKYPGVEVARPDGGFVVVYINQGKLTVRFLDARHRLVPTPVANILARYRIPGKLGEERNVLLPSSDKSLMVGPLFIRPPYDLRIRLTLDAPDGAKPEEFLVVYDLN